VEGAGAAAAGVLLLDVEAADDDEDDSPLPDVPLVDAALALLLAASDDVSVFAESDLLSVASVPFEPVLFL
jgi:hypothetical protein